MWHHDATRSAICALITLLFGLISPDLSAETLQALTVLVSNAPGAPTPDAVISYYQSAITPPGAIPLQALALTPPITAAYLLPVRARGDFLERLQEHPDSVRAQLERYLVLYFSEGTNIQIPLTALRADPYVTAAYPVADAHFSSTELS